MNSIAASYTSAALSKLLQIKLNLMIRKINFLGVEEAENSVRDLEEVSAGICIRYAGEFLKSGAILIVLPKDAALLLVDILLNKDKSPAKILDGLEKSAFDEIGNIMASAYISAIANFLKIKIRQSVPHSAIDMAGALIDAYLAQIAAQTDKVMLTEAIFIVKNKKINIKFYFLLEAGEALNLLKKAKKQNE